MSQKVNLYQSMLQTGQVQLSSGLMVKIWALAAAALMVWSGHALAQSYIQKGKLALLEHEKAELSRELDALAKRAAAWKQDPELAAGVERLEAELQSKNRLREALSNEAAGTPQGFSHVMLGFARQPVSGVWLRKFEIQGSGQRLSLEGNATAPQAVPEFLEALGRESAFSGREFKSFEIHLGDEENPVIEFSLSTEPEGRG
jgi:hypothetical protein